jgi:hypothetical protein
MILAYDVFVLDGLESAKLAQDRADAMPVIRYRPCGTPPLVFPMENGLHRRLAFQACRPQGAAQQSCRAAQLAGPGEALVSSPTAQNSASYRVLIIDDDPDFREFIRIVLETHGYRVDEADNASEIADACVCRPGSA